jgi:hypothetical protein
MLLNSVTSASKLCGCQKLDRSKGLWIETDFYLRDQIIGKEVLSPGTVPVLISSLSPEKSKMGG